MFFNQFITFQTNIFETNIINLANKCIFIVVIFVGDTGKSLLRNRQKSISFNIQQAQQRARDTEQMYLNAQIKLQDTAFEVFEIKSKTKEIIQKQDEQYRKQREENIQRLQENQKIILYYYQKKKQKEVAQETIDHVLQKVNQKLNKNFNKKAQKLTHTACIQNLLTLKN
uniref:ATP synthase CF0 subunit I n=1 Tax=Boodleopsis sp. FL1161 TaxID=2364084 RepID=A0A386AZ70_9CHLO|nr:ATP synthase CF0 subunit I [Boodleopsis sp. FL1161]